MYATVILLGALDRAADLGMFAKMVFSVLEISDYEERESVNYPPLEIYFKGFKGSTEYRIYIHDDSYSDMPFIISIDKDIDNEELLFNEIKHIFAEKLIPLGFRFERIINYGKVSEERRLAL